MRTAPPPSTRVRVFDRDECEALRDAPVTKGKVSLLEAAGAPRLIKIDSGTVRWETRAKATGFVATCTQHNDYEEEFREMRANPRLMEAMRAEARANKCFLALPGPVPGNTPRMVCRKACGRSRGLRRRRVLRILECRRVSLPEIERHGVPGRGCDPPGFLDTNCRQFVLMECLPDRPARAERRRRVTEALARDNRETGSQTLGSGRSSTRPSGKNLI